MASEARRRARLKRRLERLLRERAAAAPSPDPIDVVREYDSPADREAVGLVAAALAFGQVKQILLGVRRALEPLGPHPAERLAELAPADLLRLYRDYRYRFVRGGDLVRLLSAIGVAQRRYRSLGALFCLGDRPEEPTLEAALEAFAGALLSIPCRVADSFERRTGAASRIGFLLARPSGGSACKRMNLFLRWMIRSDDGTDLGLWPQIAPSRLIVPLDTHVWRIARYLGFTQRRTADWKAALEITAALRVLDPNDPVRYDFALAHLGISGACPGRKTSGACPSCALYGVCMRHSAG